MSLVAELKNRKKVANESTERTCRNVTARKTTRLMKKYVNNVLVYLLKL